MVAIAAIYFKLCSKPSANYFMCITSLASHSWSGRIRVLSTPLLQIQKLRLDLSKVTVIKGQTQV